ncbi:hypothetical protein M422DRAFT_222513 [Sphaerobolus stellatus SS14]|nr:hypothetical protein M422DRAFT_222513 [Sphaerobolus stellatus SS14]
MSVFYNSFYDPFAEFDRMFDAAWNSRVNGGGRTSSSSQVTRRDNNNNNATGFLSPRMDLHDSKERNEVTATFELPGMKKEDVSIDVHNNQLTVSGQSLMTETLEKDGYTHRERRFGNFSRTLPLPTGINTEAIKASMENGILTVKFPRSSPEQAAKRIDIS